jgi:hypothetical protein
MIRCNLIQKVQLHFRLTYDLCSFLLSLSLPRLHWTWHYRVCECHLVATRTSFLQFYCDSSIPQCIYLHHHPTTFLVHSISSLCQPVLNIPTILTHQSLPPMSLHVVSTYWVRRNKCGNCHLLVSRFPSCWMSIPSHFVFHMLRVCCEVVHGRTNLLR